MIDLCLAAHQFNYRLTMTVLVHALCTCHAA
jgi:hypothetical protein